MYEQITLLDREILPFYGFQGINDYQTILTIEILEQKPEFLDRLNQLSEKITTIFQQVNLIYTRLITESHISHKHSISWFIVWKSVKYRMWCGWNYTNARQLNICVYLAKISC